MSNPLYFLLVLSVFHLGGGVFVGHTLRAWLRGNFASRSLPLFIWGLFFSGIPLIGGKERFLDEGLGHFFAVELAVLGAAILIPAFAPDAFFESFDLSEIFGDTINRVLAVIGAGFVFIGVFVGGTIAGGDARFGLVFSGVFAGIGFMLFVAILIRLFRRGSG